MLRRIVKYFIPSYLRLKKYHKEVRTIDERIRWALDFEAPGPYRVAAIQKESEIKSLANMVAAIKPERIVEIGTASGGTLVLWSALASKQVISCDIERKVILKLFYKGFVPYDSNCKVDFLTGDSHSADFQEKVKNKLAGEKIDFLFIDGDHLKEGVAADFYDYLPLVRKGGLIALHDIAKNQKITSNQVQFFWEEIKDKYETTEFIEDEEQYGYGIGVIKI